MTSLPDTAWVQGVLQGFFTQRCLHVAARLGIADLLREGPLGVEELARRTGAAAQPLYRVLRFLASHGVFAESEGRAFALTPRADCLRSDVLNSVRWMFCHDVVARASHEMLHAVMTGASAFEKLAGEPFWRYLASRPEEAAWFNLHMRSQVVELASPAIEAYDWSQVRIVVDVGGGTGLFLAELLRRHAHLSGVLVDRPAVVAAAGEELSRAGVDGRCRLSPADFLQRIDASGDCYLLSRILHDWDDAEATTILRVVRAAMPPRARLLVLEMLIAEDDRRDPAKAMDLGMMVMFGGGRERTLEEFRLLLAAGGFRLIRSIPTAAPTAILESEAQ